MEGNERREKILSILGQIEGPISGTELAKQLSVSRQVIVQDVALLRAINKNILSTTKGYILYNRDDTKVNRTFMVAHKSTEIRDELNTIVDNGGKVLDVIVGHDVYGSISVDLIINNRQDVEDFVKAVEKNESVPLMGLTNGVHVHTVEADNIKVLDRIEKDLLKKGYLIKQ